MKNRALRMCIALFVFAGTLPASPAVKRLDLKLRVYEGVREGSLTPPKSVTASYIQPTIAASLPTGSGLDQEKEQILRVFNLQDVTLLTEADLVIGEGGQAPDRVRHYFRLNGSAYTVQVVLINWKAMGRFVVNFNEVVNEKPQNVLTTEMTITHGHSAVFGFENRQGKPYFCSFHITGPADNMPAAPPPPPPAPRPSHLREAIEEFERGAVKAVDAVAPPRLLKAVDPEFPEAAMKLGLEDGSVYMNIRIDEQGNVRKVMVIESSNEAFNDPAVRAVKQWKYEPYVRDGRPREVVFSVNVRFGRPQSD